MSSRNWMLLGVLSLLGGGSFFFVEVALRELPPLSIVWERVFLASIVLGAVMIASEQSYPKGALVRGALGLMGLLNNAIPFTLFAIAQGEITSGLAAILNAMTPIFTVIVAYVATTNEKAGVAKSVGVLAGFAGVALMFWGEAIGDAVAMIACLSAAVPYALAVVRGRRFQALGVAPLGTAFGQVMCSTVLVTPLWLATDRPWTLDMPQAPVLWAVVGIAGLSTALAYFAYSWRLAEAGATRQALVTFQIPSARHLAARQFWQRDNSGRPVLDKSLLARHLAGFALVAPGLVAINDRTIAVFRAASRGSSR